MSITQFKEYDYFRVMDTAEVVPAFGFSTSDNQQLTQILLTTYVHGSLSGNEILVAKLYADKALTKLIATSSNFLLSQIENIGANWYGQIGISMPTKPWIGLSNTFYVAIEATNYNYSGSNYISFLMSDDLSTFKFTLVGTRGVIE
jgi:hypothetical protein